jgi:hypothetical protein
MLLLFTSCGALRRTGNNFYANYSKKLGVNFTGKESPKLITAVDGWLGVPYRYGGTAKNGVDCSGLIVALYKEAFGISLPRNTTGMVKTMSSVNENLLQCGDVLFFTIKEKKVSHAGMYLADRKFVHASSSQGVRVASLDDVYWKKYYAGAARPFKVSADIAAKSEPQKKSQKSQKPQSKPKDNAKDNTKNNAATTHGNAQKVADDGIIVFDKDF